MVGHENLGLAILVRVQTSQLIKDENQRGVGRPSPRFRGDRERSERQRGRAPMGRTSKSEDDWF